MASYDGNIGSPLTPADAPRQTLQSSLGRLADLICKAEDLLGVVYPGKEQTAKPNSKVNSYREAVDYMVEKMILINDQLANL